MAAEKRLRGKDNAELAGYFNDSAGGGFGLILLHEYWGLNAQIRSAADKFAQQGFVVFAPDLFRGKVATDAASAEKLMRSLDWKEATVQIRHAVQALRARGPNVRVGVIGFCMGGAAALLAASNILEIAACVPFYGIPPDVGALGKIRAKVQGHYAQHDEWCSPERVNQLEQTFKKTCVAAEIYRYDAQHAFANDRRPEVYSAQNAELALSRAVAFLKANLS